MAKYVLIPAATAVSAYYSYKYFEIYKEKLQDFINDFLQTIRNTETTLNQLEKRVEALENSLNTNDSYTNGESFSFLTNDEENNKGVTINEKVPTDPYVADVLKAIKNVRKEAAELEERVRYYRGTAGDRVFKQFNEKIIRLLISLDRVDVKGYAVLKGAKKDAVEYLKEVQAVLKMR